MRGAASLDDARHEDAAGGVSVQTADQAGQSIGKQNVVGVQEHHVLGLGGRETQVAAGAP
jgi:hypothetical protein